jgi:tRNA threonylcarbamoyl adenosine modification protein (Sua5/YciO/YrdC/YwlC family)
MSDRVDAAVSAALAGRLVVLPTDTVYGIGTRPDDPAATGRLFDAKGRPRELELPVLVASTEDAQRIAVFDRRAAALTDTHWPGALTIVLPRERRSLDWDLGGDPATIGVRVPDHPLALAILSRTGPLAVTSANRTGEATPGSCHSLIEVFGDLVDVYVCQDDRPPGLASTVLDLTGDLPRVLRQGSVAFRWPDECGASRDLGRC